METPYSPLANFVLTGLRNCWQPELGWFSHAYRLQPQPHNVSVPHSDLYYTLNVLLGMAALPDKGQRLDYDLREIFTRCARDMVEMPVPVYAYGMAMWVSAELEMDLPGPTRQKIADLLERESNWTGLAAQDVGLMVSGVSRLARQGDGGFSAAGSRLYEFLASRLGNTRSDLFFNNAKGPRRRLSTFATGVYSTLACLHYGEAFGNAGAIDRGLNCARALAARQGPRGEWPWFYEADSGRVVDPYQVYSVHQDGMAPAYLHLAESHGYAEARTQIEQGFAWILGNNEMGISMLVPDRGIILRSQLRNEPLERYRRALRGNLNWLTGRESSYAGGDHLRLNQECRSYHLGWVLHSFGGRQDYPALTHNDAFVLPEPATDAQPASTP